MKFMKVTKKHLILAVLFIAILPIAIVLSSTLFTVSSTLEGIALMQEGRGEIIHNPTKAIEIFRHSKLVLDRPVQLLRNSDIFTKIVSVFPPFSWSLDLNRASANLSEAGTTVAELIESYPQIEKTTDISSLLSGQSSAFSPWFSAHKDTLDLLNHQLVKANESLQNTPNFIALSKRSELEAAKAQLQSVSQSLPTLIETISDIQQAAGIGSVDPRTFLIVFQNNGELRPTGGFIGSYATITASSGILRKFTFGENVYTLNKNIVTPVAPPTALTTINPSWGFQDSNVGSGFLNDASENVSSLYQKAAGEKPVAILYFDVSILEDVLKATGPISLPKSDEIVTSDTIADALNRYTEQSYFLDPANQAVNRPKDILADLIPVLLDNLSNNVQAQRTFFGSVSETISRKSLQFWLADKKSNNTITKLLPVDKPLAGSSWIKLVNTNIGGVKSSRKIDETMTFTKDQDILTLSLTRQHKGTNTFPDGDNKNFSELYLPAGTAIISQPQPKGGESQLPNGSKNTPLPTIEMGAQYTRLGFWSTTKVGETNSFQIKFQLPEALRSRPMLMLKQAGAVNEKVITPNKTFDLVENTLVEF